jgi:hypothetical protein
VDLNLRVNGCVFPLTHTARDRVILQQETPLPEGPAEVVVTIDGVETRRAVEIADRHLCRRIVPITLGSKL